MCPAVVHRCACSVAIITIQHWSRVTSSRNDTFWLLAHCTLQKAGKDCGLLHAAGPCFTHAYACIFWVTHAHAADPNRTLAQMRPAVMHASSERKPYGTEGWAVRILVQLQCEATKSGKAVPTAIFNDGVAGWGLPTECKAVPAVLVCCRVCPRWFHWRLLGRSPVIDPMGLTSVTDGLTKAGQSNGARVTAARQAQGGA
mmetsp:Transcript_10231/g.30820  ORF Transcript_10231/g.30820 Transcript_10231/m.30820 type:complete len:200 (-) Transcript_10231:145-744(-)